jgi:hypothetical protein
VLTADCVDCAAAVMATAALILGQINAAKAALLRAQDTAEVAEVMTDMLDKVEEIDVKRQLAELQTLVAESRGLAETTKASWKNRQQELKQETKSLGVRCEEQRRCNNNYNTKSSEVEYAIEVLQHQQQVAETIETERTKQADITRLPGSCLTHVMGMLPLSDATAAFRVCHRWQRSLDMEGTWRTQALRQLQLHTLDVKERQKFLDAKAAAPKSLSGTSHLLYSCIT